MCTSLFRELLTYMMEDPRNITFCIHLLFCAKNIERMGDHATNIAETVYYMIEGRADRRPAAEGRHHQLRHAGRGAMTRSSNGTLAMKPRILIVEDEEPLTLLLRYNLEAEGYEVETVAARRRGRHPLREERAPDLVVLDWMLPGLSGIELCRRLRARPETKAAADHHADRARRGERARARARDRRRRLHRQAVLGAGTDRARARAAAPRAAPERVADVLSFGDIELDREKKRVSRGGRAIDLGPTEFRLLEFLMERPGRVFSREQLLDGVWGSDVYIDERTVDVHVGRLRKALNRGHEADPIRTVRGAGYALDDRFGKVA